MNNQNPREVPTWKKQVHDYFNKNELSTESRSRLRAALLLASSPSTHQPKQTLITIPPSTRWKNPVLSSILSAALAASFTFLMVKPASEETLDPIAELTQLPGPKVYPPDFDLEGDSRAMHDIVYELFADKNFFVSDLPAQVLAEYKPSEGRFFSWDGEPAVSIQMHHQNTAQAKKANGPTTLLIVKLSEKSQRKFPNEKLTRKVAGKAGKMRKVKVWREGNFGYAMVQDAVAVNDTP
ncbi:hypothetical protein EBU99_11570 [bacterium]|nr:hypothetical protein [bacterium]